MSYEEQILIDFDWGDNDEKNTIDKVIKKVKMKMMLKMKER